MKKLFLLPFLMIAMPALSMHGPQIRDIGDFENKSAAELEQPGAVPTALVERGKNYVDVLIETRGGIRNTLLKMFGSWGLLALLLPLEDESKSLICAFSGIGAFVAGTYFSKKIQNYSAIRKLLENINT